MAELVRSEEYRALRATIRERGSVRLIVIVITFSVWAAAVLAARALFAIRFLNLAPLTVLAAGFETAAPTSKRLMSTIQQSGQLDTLTHERDQRR